METWYGVTIILPDKNIVYFCQLEGEPQEVIFSKKEDDFIKLLNVRWTEKDEDGKRFVIPLDGSKSDYGDYVFVKKKHIHSVYSTNQTAIF